MTDHINDRALYAPLREHRNAEITWPLLPGEEPATKWARLPACTGNCHQGRRLCVTPDACRLPEDDDMSDGAGAVVVPAVVAFALACAALVALLAGWL